MTALKWITTEAKKLKKAHPKKFGTWREYVTHASVIYNKKKKKTVPKKKSVSGLDSVKRQGNKTVVNYSNKKNIAVKKTTKQAVLFGIGSVTQDLKGKLIKAQAMLKKLQGDQKAIPHIKKIITKLKKAI